MGKPVKLDWQLALSSNPIQRGREGHMRREDRNPYYETEKA